VFQLSTAEIAVEVGGGASITPLTGTVVLVRPIEPLL